MKINNSFGQWLKLRRKALDLTQIELADQVGCAVVTMRKFERDIARPSKQIAERLADALALSPDERTAFIAFARHQVERLPVPSAESEMVDPPANLPRYATPFIGRADEIEKIADALNDPYCHLLTLTGVGGVGKTRLAVQVAEQERRDFRQGVHFVPLAPLSSPDHIIPAIANTFGLLLRSDEFQRQQLLAYLRDRQLLLILDNFEHLLDGVALITDILEAAPDVKLLVTSREALNLQEEWIRRVKGMELPADDRLENIGTYSAVQLFLDRARRVNSDFSLTDERRQIVRIIRLVDGMPLAIELAATWRKTMTCEQIADAIQHDIDFLSTPLRNVPERHRSIRAVFERSWQRLTDEEQTIFRRLSVFRGGFTSDAANGVVGASLGVLTALTDKSLLQLVPNGRYDLHELLRQYSAEHLELAGEANVIPQAHAGYYADFMQRLAGSLKNQELPVALQKIKADWDNVRAACLWLIAQRDFERFGQLVECLWRYGLDYRIAEVQELWQQALDQFAPRAGETPSILWGRLLTRTADIFELRGPSAALASGLAYERIAQGLEIVSRSGDATEIGVGLCERGQLFRLQGNDNEALKCYTDAIFYHRQSDDPSYLGSTYHWIGFIQHALGQLEDSLRSFQQQLNLSRAIGDSAGEAWALLRIGGIYHDSGHTQDAVCTLQESEMLHQSIGNVIGLSNCALLLGHFALLSGNFEQARVKIEAALRLSTDCGAQIERCCALANRGVLTCLEGDPERAKQLFNEAGQFPRVTDNWGLGLLYCEEENVEAAQKCVTVLQCQGLDHHSPALMVLSLPVQAFILAHEGAPERAVELLGLAAACPAHWIGWMTKWSLLNRLHAELENMLGAAAYQAAWERGRKLDLKTVIRALAPEPLPNS